MDSRQQFEEWASKNNLLVDKTKLGTYCFGDTRDTWLAWQASRESVVIDLPPRMWSDADAYIIYAGTDAKGDCLDYDETVKAIQSAGINYK